MTKLLSLRMLKYSVLIGSVFVIFFSSACTRESHRTVQPQSVSSHYSSYSGPKYRLALGKFENRSPYMRGIFSDGTDRLGNQARQILKTHLSQSNRFTVLDRINMDSLARESKYAGRKQKISGGQVVVTGAVTEFGRRNVGHNSLGGLISKSKSQLAYGKVQISVVDVNTSEVLASYQGAGEYQLSTRQVLGFGSKAGYDSTLADKVLNLAMMEAVNNMVTGLERREWSPN